ncbi:heterokaryon incompatibility protein-domain-containing protein [Lasiosphaeria ovina]|uniref:Heterokaryon incompatibility protein-domain-containing protein n=1 Tax=Lasiosphaeria ovina TaxID=92902 RepID=A0AAE0NNA8_9PEZI|nr:heterokaryon incompatibility protein-domain-containing protein [Lasiosphaeria ovina]
MANYAPLDAMRREIRLLSLCPGTNTEPLRCSLSVVSLDHVQSYEALSYVWGPADPHTQVVLDGKPFPVTQNLHAVLRRLRRIDESRTLWVDAICINQVDTAEKSVQVALMSAIYSNATGALLWLGEEPEVPVATVSAVEAAMWTDLLAETDKFLAELTSVVDQWQWPDENTTNLSTDLRAAIQAPVQPSSDDFVITHTRPHAWYGDERDLPAVTGAWADPSLAQDSIFHAFALFRLLAFDWHLSAIPYLAAEPETGSHRIYNPVHARRAAHWLATRSWWSRIWTVQECILPARCTLLYGPVTMPWDVLLDGLFSFQRHRDTCCSALTGVHDMLNLPVETVLQLRALRGQALQGKGRVSLAQVLPKFRHRGATDARDKVYALLPLVTDWYGAASLVPAYHLSVAEVYTSAVAKIIRDSGSLDILCRPPEQAEHMRLSELPSWVMDLSQPATAGGTLDRLEKQLTLYNACGDIPMRAVQFYDGGKVLALEGAMVDTIKRASTIMMYENQSAAKDTVGWWYKVGEEELGTDPQWREKFARTLCGDTMQVPGSEGTVVGFRRANVSELDRLFSWLNDTQVPHDTSSLSHLVKATTQMRAFVVSTEGRTGLVPSLARLTFPRPDQIFLFPGGRTPFVLRDVGIRDIPGVGLKHCHQFLGDCYLDGVMDGQIAARLVDGKEVVYIV